MVGREQAQSKGKVSTAMADDKRHTGVTREQYEHLLL